MDSPSTVNPLVLSQNSPQTQEATNSNRSVKQGNPWSAVFIKLAQKTPPTTTQAERFLNTYLTQDHTDEGAEQLLVYLPSDAPQAKQLFERYIDNQQWTYAASALQKMKDGVFREYTKDNLASYLIKSMLENPPSKEEEEVYFTALKNALLEIAEYNWHDCGACYNRHLKLIISTLGEIYWRQILPLGLEHINHSRFFDESFAGIPEMLMGFQNENPQTFELKEKIAQACSRLDTTSTHYLTLVEQIIKAGPQSDYHYFDKFSQILKSIQNTETKNKACTLIIRSAHQAINKNTRPTYANVVLNRIFVETLFLLELPDEKGGEGKLDGTLLRKLAERLFNKYESREAKEDLLRIFSEHTTKLKEIATLTGKEAPYTVTGRISPERHRCNAYASVLEKLAIKHFTSSIIALREDFIEGNDGVYRILREHVVLAENLEIYKKHALFVQDIITIFMKEGLWPAARYWIIGTELEFVIRNFFIQKDFLAQVPSAIEVLAYSTELLFEYGTQLLLERVKNSASDDFQAIIHRNLVNCTTRMIEILFSKEDITPELVASLADTLEYCLGKSFKEEYKTIMAFLSEKALTQCEKDRVAAIFV